MKPGSIQNSYQLLAHDTAVYTPDLLMMYLYKCLQDNRDAVIDFCLEGWSAETTGLYRLLDTFCDQTGYSRSRITIYTANMLEKHSQYQIVRVPDYWYELEEIKQWLIGRDVTCSSYPTKHFGHFVGRSSWARLWLSAILDSRYADQTLQTFHSGFGCNYVVPKEHGVTDMLGLEQLNNYNCSAWSEVIDFLKTCPRILDDAELTQVNVDDLYIKPNNSNCYPIQHPANLIILNRYNDIFVDLVEETCAVGDIFFTTEKTWRPIIAGRPLILMSTRESLLNLKKLGFETFSDFWDESYDDYECQDRVYRIIEVLDTIAQWSTADIQQQLVKMKPILEHNQAVFNTLTYEKIAQVFND